MDKHFTLPYEGGLTEKNLPAGILHNYERIWTDILPERRDRLDRRVLPELVG